MHDGSRRYGVELDDLADELDRIVYPIERESLLERCGERELDLENGTTTVREVLERERVRTYESRSDVERRILILVETDAIGREAYSDRGGAALGIDREDGTR
jgi:hypothetical protein